MQDSSTSMQNDIETKCVNTIRALAMDAVAKANSGHTGTPMALAPVAHILFTRILRYNPQDPTWYNRDRFVLSAGHASMLIYGSLHLAGFDISLDDIKQFRQLDSKTPGHPEVHHTPGVEVTTGPLGQGFANAVGMAIAQKYVSKKIDSEHLDHNIYVLCSDGDLMEGVSYEAASIAGHNKLSNLIAIYDDNKITIDGSTDLTFSENVAGRFKSQGWNVIEAGEISEDLDAIEAAIKQAQDCSDAPTIIILNSHIGYPSPAFTDTSKAHGAITDKADLDATKVIMGFGGKEFSVDQDVLDFYSECRAKNVANYEKWVENTKSSQPIQELISGTNEALSQFASEALENYFCDSKPSTGDQIATRVSCSEILSTISNQFDSLIGGSADLTGNTGTKLENGTAFTPQDNSGNQIYFGIREHAMAAAANGMALGYNLRPFVGTFFVFADYMRPAIRIAAISKAPVLFVFSHDSIGVGEDGPTHQPIEQLASLRAMPGLKVIRPADAYETAAAIESHLGKSDGPTALILTRQNIPTLEGTKKLARNGVEVGAYTLVDSQKPDVILTGTGSEVHLCIDAAKELEEKKINVKVVSIPCMENFFNQSEAVQNEIFNVGVPVLSIEAGSTFGWSSIADETIGIDRFGASAPASEVFTILGITSAALVQAATKLVSK
jgi:transketolase